MTSPIAVKPRPDDSKTRVKHAGLSEVGQVRAVNQDSFWADDIADKGFLAVVADGMGGHKAGEIASQKAVTVMSKTLEHSTEVPPTAIAKAVQAANLEIYNYASDNPEHKGMGTTLSSVFIDDQVGLVAHIGDSRAYLIREGTIRQLTQDHSWVAERVRLGILTADEARNHRWRNVITNALGANPEIKLDMMSFEVLPQDRILLCSDGITSLIEDETLAKIVSQYSPDQAVEELIDRANEQGSPDNVTAVIVSVEVIEAQIKPYITQNHYEFTTVKIKDTLSGIRQIEAAYPQQQRSKQLALQLWHGYRNWLIGGGALVVVLLLWLIFRN
ncbi:MAG: Stp1/IreP family PP2C-type Ser/Thr phosphatase [Deinococcota bacterium]